MREHELTVIGCTDYRKSGDFKEEIQIWGFKIILKSSQSLLWNLPQNNPIVRNNSIIGLFIGLINGAIPALGQRGLLFAQIFFFICIIVIN